MKKQPIALLFSIGLLACPQPGFAMDRANSDGFGDNSNYFITGLLTFVTFFQIHYSQLSDLLENNNPFYYDNTAAPASPYALNTADRQLVLEGAGIRLTLPREIFIQILRFAGPDGPTQLWSVSRSFRELINALQRWTVVATIQVGQFPQSP